MSEPHAIVTEHDGILIFTLNRPDKLNALSKEIFQTLDDSLLRFRDTPELKVMLIRATGRYFCAGVDLKSGGGSGEIADTGVKIRERHRTQNFGMHRIYDEMEHIEKPIVVAHQAACVGGGLELSLSCDFRLAAASASYAFPEGKFGVLPASNGVSRLTRYVGPHWARYLIMANKTADAQKALVMGLVHEVYPDESFDEDALDFCRHLAKQHSEQMGAAKIAIEMAHELGRDQARHVERMANSTLMLNPGYLDGIRRHIDGVGGSKK